MINTKYKINTLIKEFEAKSKDVLPILEKRGLGEKSRMAVLEPDEFDVFLTALTAEAQIKDMGAYLNGETKILVSREAPAPKSEEKPGAKKPTENAGGAAAEKQTKQTKEEKPQPRRRKRQNVPRRLRLRKSRRKRKSSSASSIPCKSRSRKRRKSRSRRRSARKAASPSNSTASQRPSRPAPASRP